MSQWTKFNEVLEQLTRWLSEARQDLMMAAEPKVELMEKKVQIDKLKVSILPPDGIVSCVIESTCVMLCCSSYNVL